MKNLKRVINFRKKEKLFINKYRTKLEPIKKNLFR